MHATFDRAAGMITEYGVQHGAYSVTLIGKPKGFDLSRVQVENMKFILDGETRQELYKEDPQLIKDTAKIEKHQERMAPVVEHLRVRKAKT